MTGEDDATRAPGTDAVMIYTTFPNEAAAEIAAEALVRKGLVACANILPGAHSIYIWQGKLEKEREAITFMKTRYSLRAAAISALRDVHPYENPAIVALPIADGSVDYLAWIKAQTCDTPATDSQQQSTGYDV